MKKLVTFTLLALMGLSVAGAVVRDAFAIPPFKKEFDAMYVKEGTEFAKKVEEVKCNVCHVGTNKKDRNAYGEELAKLLDRKTDMNKPAKIKEALKKVEEMKSVAGDDNSPSFGKLLQEGKLPGGEKS
ncbi:MAG: hypothetical protein MPJ50_15095 [Pirellulales bacterium]|nr:hypothetical protein [Pirellulales bacterium]